MSDAPRKIVNILAVCEADTSEAKKKSTACKKTVSDAEARLALLKQEFESKLIEANSELSELASLINANKRQDVPTEKLEKKAADIRERIRTYETERSESARIVAAMDEIKKAKKILDDSEDVVEACKNREEIAKELKAAFEKLNIVGAIEAPEYETLNEAVHDYVDHMPVAVRISKDMIVDEVGFWQVPNPDKPHTAKVFAKKGVQYRYDRLPSSLDWLRYFPGSDYSSMPRRGEQTFKISRMPFVIDDSDQASPSAAGKNDPWMDKQIYQHFQTAEPSLFCPKGISYSTQKEGYALSGLCYIKTEGKFFSLWPRNFPSIQMVPGKVKKEDRWGAYQMVDGEVPQSNAIDASKLFEAFSDYFLKELNSAVAELEDLSKAKTELALRIKEAIEQVCSLEPAFESQTRRLSEDEVYKEVGAYWDAFVKAPWEESVRGDVAMIKHLCERKIETPHVWSLKTKGHYGLRVRTRDHDWILAEMYCPPANLCPKDGIGLDEVRYVKDGYVKAGPCFIYISGRQR